MKEKKFWLRPRHRLIRNLAYLVLYPYSRLKFGITIEKFKEQEDRPYLIVLNHQTAFDQFFVGMAFKGPFYYMATEDIFSLGWISHVLRYVVAPIPIRKQTTDIQAVKTCIKVAKEGGTIAIAPEGNRTYDGRTVYMNPTIAPLAKKLNMPLVIFRIEGGYGVQPRWTDKVRKGKMRAYVHQVIQPEEMASMTNEELFQRIRDGLYVNEASASGTFVHKKSAEYLERVVYVCPNCGLSVFESHNDIIRCKTCARQVRYLPTKELQGVGFDFPFRFVADWYDYQCDFINHLDPGDHLDTPLFRDTVRLSEVIVFQRKNVLRKQAQLALYGDRITIDDDLVLPFDELSTVTCLGRNKLNIYHGNMVYQIKGDKRFNALKYMNLYHRYKNAKAGDGNGKFLGL